MRAHPFKKTNDPRRGTILPIVAVLLVSLCGFVALAVDVGMMAVAKTECQNAADSAAMAGARTIDGSASPNLTGATAAAQDAAIANKILAASVEASNVSIRHGTYHYETTTEAFKPEYTVAAPDTYNLTEATVTRRNNSGFMAALGVNHFDVAATATAAHRPRDVSIVLDFSGSMNDESDLWNNVATGHLGSFNYKTNNSDPDIPKFGHYSDTTTAALRNTSSDPRTGKSNVTQTSLGIPPMVNDFYQHGRGSTGSPAFTSVAFTGPDNYATTSPGDKYKFINGSTTVFAKTVQEITGASNTAVTNRTDPVMPSYTPFQGFTRGPDYWGKTFFIWPPDQNSPSPSTPSRDWRQKFFSTNNNTRLWDTDGDWKAPSGSTYTINYAAILNWIKTTPNPFPTQLRSGRILYYSAIPTDVPASAYTHTNANSAITNADQRFWKEYIDYVLGVWRDPYGNVIPADYQGLYPVWSMGPDYAWGTVRIGTSVNYSSAPTTRMHPQDNPKRPRHRFWFGPMTMIQFMSDTGLLPGNGHDISLYPAKLGIAGALKDIENNHPNDLVHPG